MNANEVIATLLGAHPNDHVNMGQSSNDVIPTAVHMAALDKADSSRRCRALARGGLDRGQGRGALGGHQDRPHAPEGRDADPHGQEFAGYAGAGPSSAVRRGGARAAAGWR